VTGLTGLQIEVKSVEIIDDFVTFPWTKKA